jgi:hypothetical protein
MTPAPTAALACVVKLLAEQIAGAKEHEGAGVALLMDEAEAILQQLRDAAAMRDALAAKLADLDGREIHHFSGSVRYELPDSWFDDLRNALQKGAGDGR